MSDAANSRPRGYYTVAVSPHSGVARVSAALRRGLDDVQDLGDYVLDRARGGLLLRDAAGERRIARGFTPLGRNPFYLSLAGRVPAPSAKGFIDNQNLAFLKLPRCGLFVHDLFYRTHPDRPRDRLLGELLYRGAGDYPFYLANSEYTKGVLCDLFKVSPEKVHAVPLDCDRAIFHPRPVDREAFLARWGLPADRRYLLHVSSGDKRKNYPRVLEAFGLVRAEFPDVDLVRVGASLHADNLARERALVARFGLEGRTRHLRGLADADVAAFYNLAEALVFPSLAEGFGLPLIEAQACGCPCVTSATTALGEVAGPLCDTVDPRDTTSIADGLRAVLRDPSRRVRAADANREFLTRFSWEPARALLREWMR